MIANPMGQVKVANLMGRGDIIKLFILFKTLSPLFRS